MRLKKPKAVEPSAKDKLSADFTERLEKKWREQGDAVLEAAFKESPTKIAEMIARLVSTTEAKEGGYGACRDMHEVGIKLLKSIGFNDPDEASIQEALKENDTFIARLEAIWAKAEGQLQ